MTDQELDELQAKAQSSLKVGNLCLEKGVLLPRCSKGF